MRELLPLGPVLTGYIFCPLQAVVQLEGDNKLVTTFKGIKSVTEFSGDTVTSVSLHSQLGGPCTWGWVGRWVVGVRGDMKSSDYFLWSVSPTAS